jgi:hypothetical protein
MSEKLSDFYYHFLFKVVPYLEFNAFGFWRIWYAQYELYYPHFLQLITQQSKSEVK